MHVYIVYKVDENGQVIFAVCSNDRAAHNALGCLILDNLDQLEAPSDALPNKIINLWKSGNDRDAINLFNAYSGISCVLVLEEEEVVDEYEEPCFDK